MTEDNGEYKRWLRGALLMLVGASESAMVEYVDRVARDATDEANFVRELTSTLGEDTVEMSKLRAFAHDVFIKIGRSENPVMVNDDAEEDISRKRSRGGRGRRRLFDDIGNDGDGQQEQEEEDTAVTQLMPSPKRQSISPPSAVASMRHERTAREIEILRRKVADEEQRFAGIKLTEAEKRQHSYNKQTLDYYDRISQIDKEMKSAASSGFLLMDDYFTPDGRIDTERMASALSNKQNGSMDNSEKGNSWLNERLSRGLISTRSLSNNISATKESPSMSTKAISTTSASRQQKTALAATTTTTTTTTTAATATPTLSPETNETSYDYVLEVAHLLDKFQSASTSDMSNQHTAHGINSATQSAAQNIVNKARSKEAEIRQMRQSLPVYSRRDALLKIVSENQFVIVSGDTGSGKTTQIPQYLHEAGYTKDGKMIGCTQPRRVAAMSVAARVADEMRCKIGDKVGYSIRFENNTTHKTVIKYLTEGILLKEITSSPDLNKYSAIIIDEAHERTLHTDVLLALLKDIAKARPELRVIISSATANAQKFQDYFGGAPCFIIPGRMYPIDKYYAKSPESDYITAAATTVLNVHATTPVDSGDILVFLTGQDDIENVQGKLEQACAVLGSRINELVIAPVYSNLPQDQQAKIFEPAPQHARKVVLATNIAETSITIDNIVYVVDCGMVKQSSFDPRSNMASLDRVPCSRAASEQRAGRAGRVRPGKCYRLYTEHAFNTEMEQDTPPEILRCNLALQMLLLLQLGINIVGFDYLDPPPVSTTKHALGMLYALGALAPNGRLSTLGRKMAEFPLDPHISKMLIESAKFGCSNDIISIAAMLGEASSLFVRPVVKRAEADRAHQSFKSSAFIDIEKQTTPQSEPVVIKYGGDHLALLRIWNQWCESSYSKYWCRENYINHRALVRVRDVRNQLIKLMSEKADIQLNQQASGTAQPVDILKAITAGFFTNCARLTNTKDYYRPLKGNNTMRIHPSSALASHQSNGNSMPEYVIYLDIMRSNDVSFMRQVISIDVSWLRELAPHYYGHELGLKSAVKKPVKTLKR